MTLRFRSSDAKRACALAQTQADRGRTLTSVCLTASAATPSQRERLAAVLSNRERYRMFMRYNDSWWIGDRDAFTEIISSAQTQKLDTWHRRLNEGALWAQWHSEQVSSPASPARHGQ